MNEIKLNNVETKADLALVKDNIKSNILENADPKDAAIYLKMLETLIADLRSDEEIKEFIQNELDKYPEKTFTYKNVTFGKSERASYEFDNCQDTQLNTMYAHLEQIKQQIKGRENWLKTLKEGTPDIETGEIVWPPVKKIASIVSVTIKK